MKKADIATQIHQQTGISIEEAARLLNRILGLLKAILQAGESITSSGFGSLLLRSTSLPVLVPLLGITIFSANLRLP